MEWKRLNGTATAGGASDIIDGVSAAERSASSPLYPNYHSTVVQEALERLACIDLIELCNEARVEQCRATRDLRSCGRYVQHVLNSCRHASLCAECSQRCDICPLCRIPLPMNGHRIRLRLYYECIEAGLISKKYDDRFQEKEEEKQLSTDVHRLYLLFDVALDNNLVSLICHYVTDVCMDESAVSSNPLLAFLLDEVVVKDWCKRTFKNIRTELKWIYNLEVEEMKVKLSLLLKFSVQLAGLSTVLEVLESSFKGTVSAQLQDLHHLQESILKTKQHLEIMMWCTRHQFLQIVSSRYSDLASWNAVVGGRKSAATHRSWPDSVNQERYDKATLFIEDALSNLELNQEYTQKTGAELEILSSRNDGSSSILRSRIEGVAGCYPFENLRAATDILFLSGNSDLVVAKRAIFMYYLFDRHWTMPEEKWRHIVDDFAATFGITRHSILESLTFYLLDDSEDAALQEACRLLPEISGPTTHPKIAQVLLERQNPDAALMVLRWSGLEESPLVSLSEAVTAVRVRVECSLLTEAYMYQRTLCMRVKETNNLKGEWGGWVEALVTEICLLCIRRNLVDRMIELPWNSAEEKYLHKCLLDYAIAAPSTTVGSLLVVFYLQRYLYIEAYQVDRKLQTVEQEFISRNSTSEDVLLRMRSASHWRAGLVDKCIELLPEVQQQELKSGKLPEMTVFPDNEVETSMEQDFQNVQIPNTTTLLVNLASDSSCILGMGHSLPSSRPPVLETPTKLAPSISDSRFGVGNYGPQLGIASRSLLKPQFSVNRSSKFGDMSSLKEINRSSSRARQNSQPQEDRLNRGSPEVEQTVFFNQFQNTSSPPYSRGVTATPVTTPSNNYGLLKESSLGFNRDAPSGKRVLSEMPFSRACSDDLMDISQSHGEKGLSNEDNNVNGMPRWRSDEASDDENEQSGVILAEVASHTTSTRRPIRRFARR